MAKVIVIDGYIGPFGYSKQYIRYLLSDAKKDEEVVVELSSLGGSIDHALNINKQFADHGNVTVKLNSFNASSATIIALGANKVLMAENSFYLIHKVMGWVDEFGYKNADDLDELIKKLEKEKKENEKIDVVIAKMYLNRSSKSLEEIIELMKQNTWINADEALEWGFVDEVYKSKGKVNHLDDMKLVAMIDAAGYPMPKRETNNEHTMKTTDDKKDQKSVIASVKEQVNKVLTMLGGDPEKENKEEKTETVEVSLQDQVTELQNQVKDLVAKLNEKKEEKTEEKQDEKTDEKSEAGNNEALAKEIEALKTQLANLAGSATEDQDEKTDGDAKKNARDDDDFMASIDRAKQFREIYDLN